MIANLIVAMLVFVLMTRPEKMLGIVAYLTDLHADWKQGSITEEDLYRLMRVAKKIQWLALFSLFGFSFMCGSLIAFLQLSAAS